MFEVVYFFEVKRKKRYNGKRDAPVGGERPKHQHTYYFHSA